MHDMTLISTALVKGYARQGGLFQLWDVACTTVTDTVILFVCACVACSSVSGTVMHLKKR